MVQSRVFFLKNRQVGVSAFIKSLSDSLGDKVEEIKARPGGQVPAYKQRLWHDQWERLTQAPYTPIMVTWESHMAKCNSVGPQMKEDRPTWNDFHQKCMRIDPYLAVEYSTEIYDAWISGDTPEGAVSHARKIYHEYEE